LYRIVVVNSNLSHTSHGFVAMAIYWSKKSPNTATPVSFNVLAGGDPLRICQLSLHCKK